MPSTTREEAITLVARLLYIGQGGDPSDVPEWWFDQAEVVVDLLRESGLLNDQRYEQVGRAHKDQAGNWRVHDTTSIHMNDVPVFRRVDVPGETP